MFNMKRGKQIFPKYEMKVSEMALNGSSVSSPQDLCSIGEKKEQVEYNS